MSFAHPQESTAAAHLAAEKHPDADYYTAENLLRLAAQAWADRDQKNARKLVEKSLLLPMDAVNNRHPAVWESYMVLYNAMSDEVDAAELDSIWLDCAERLIITSPPVVVSEVKKCLRAFTSDYGLLSEEEARVFALAPEDLTVGHFHPEVPHHKLPAAILSVLDAAARYRDLCEKARRHRVPEPAPHRSVESEPADGSEPAGGSQPSGIVPQSALKSRRGKHLKSADSTFDRDIEISQNLMRKTMKALVAGDSERALNYVQRALRFDVDENWGQPAGTFGAHLMLYEEMTDEAESCACMELCWIDRVERLMESSSPTSIAEIRSIASAFANEQIDDRVTAVARLTLIADGAHFDPPVFHGVAETDLPRAMLDLAACITTYQAICEEAEEC
ncbi:MAG: hypothetical protein ACRC0L_04490 [Angustibacter sp.]